MRLLKDKPIPFGHSTVYCHPDLAQAQEILRHSCSRDFALATGRNDSLPSIGWKGRVLVRMEIKIDRKQNEKPLHTRLGLSSTTLHQTVREQIISCKQDLQQLAIKILSNKPAKQRYARKNYNITKSKDKYTFSGWNGPPCPSLGEHLSMDGELWLNGEMEEREGEWLERKMVSRNSHGKHNDRE